MASIDETAMPSIEGPGSVQLTHVRRKPVPTVSTVLANTIYEPVQNSEDDTEKGESLGSRKTSPLIIIVDVVLCLVPISFLVLAGIALSLDGKQLSEYGHNVEQWSLLSPTLFPLIFSAVVGRSLSFFARYWLERGTSLGILEQLLGSQTVFGAIWTQWVLRSLNTLGILLVALWLISPLGGQASLRLLSEITDVHQGNTTFAYVNMTVPIERLQNAQAYTVTSMDAMYKANLLAPLSLKNSSQDSWGNIKLPNFGTYNSSLDSEGYATIPENDVDWSSLMGQPVAGLQSNINSTFIMTVQYHDLNCSQMYKRPANSTWLKDILNNTSSNPINFWNLYSDNTATPPMTTWMLSDNYYWSDDLTLKDDNRREFFWVSKSGWKVQVEDPSKTLNYNETCITKCSMSAYDVDALVQCSGKICRVAKVKKSTSADQGSILTVSWSTLWGSFWAHWVKTDVESALYASSVTEQYIYGRIESPFQYGATSDGPSVGYLDLTEVSQSDFTRRLRTLLNTYYMASLAPAASTGSLMSANVTDVLNGNRNFTGGYFPVTIASTRAAIQSSTNVYHCHKGFFALAVISSTILLITGLVGTLAKYRCKGPDIFGYVTSLVRHNPYTPLPEDQGVRDTDELARRSKKMLLRLEDVRYGTGVVGHLAVSSLRTKSVRVLWTQVPNRKYK